MNYIVACFFVLLQGGVAYSQSDREGLLTELNEVIDSTKIYDAEKLDKIKGIRKYYQKTHHPADQYDRALQLYEAYKIFKFDSAFVYAKKLEKIASALNDTSRLTASRIRLSFILLSAGMFKETSDHLGEINIKDRPDSLKAGYYSLTGRYYYDLATYDNDHFHSPAYVEKGNRYIDSALLYLPANSFDYYFYRGLKSLKQEAVEKAYSDYQALLSRPDLTHHQTALVASTLGLIHLKKGEVDKAIDYQVRASIADIRSSTKETYAIFNLAELLFEQGDFKSASLYIEKAIEDASFYGARQRKVQVSTILPIIEGKRIGHIEGQRRLWIIYAVVVTFFLAVLGFLITVINRQVNKLKNAKRIITEAHANLHEVNAKLEKAYSELQEVFTELQKVNTELQEANSKLLEANKIKEEYIGYFFNINSDFFQKIEKFKKSIEQKIADGKLDEIRFLVNNINIKKEKEELLKSFDKVFLKLFPNFVEEFNALFKEEDQVKFKDNELLNTDMRIFALIRMGITENEKIAQVLEYSVNTIYAYKTKIKNRAIVSKEEFDKKVMEIKSI